MPKHLISLVVLCFSLASFAQSTSDIKAPQRKNSLFSQQNTALKDQRITIVAEYNLDFEKSPLVYIEWQLGSIHFQNEQKADSVLLNVDTKLNSLVFKLSEEYNPFKIENDGVSGFIFFGEENRNFVRKYKSDFKELRNALPFFEVLFENNDFTVLKQETKRIAPEKSEIGYSTKPEDKYRADINYFFRKGTNLYEDVSLNKKGFKNMASGDQYEKVQDFVKNNKLKWGDEADMIKVFKEFF